MYVGDRWSFGNSRRPLKVTVESVPKLAGRTVLLLLSRAIPEDDLAECRGSVGLHPGKDVLVDLHREGHAGVAEAFTDHLDRHAGLEQEGCVGMPHVVEPDPGKVHLRDETLEGLGEVVGVERLAIGLGEDEP